MLLSKRELRKKRREKTYKSTPMTTNYMKNCSTSLIRDMHIKSRDNNTNPQEWQNENKTK